jgi:hypothetical protein
MIESTVQEDRTEQYRLVDDAYHGRRETDKNYKNRVECASYTNFIKPIISAQVDPVFSQMAQRGATNSDDKLKSFLLDTDNNGTGIQKLIYKAVTQTTLMKNFFIIVDNFPEEEIPKSDADAIRKRKLPYVYTKSIMDVSEYKQDKFGKLIEITFKYGVTAPSEEKEQCFIYKKFTCYGSEKYYHRKDGTKITVNSIDYGWGRVPVAFYNKDEITPQPPYYQIARMSKKIYNIESRLDDLNQAQSFSILLIPSVNQSAEKDGSMVVGKYNALFFNSESAQAPTFISPDSSLMDSSLEYYNTTKGTLVASADVLGSTAEQRTSKGESGKGLAIKWFGKSQEVKNKARVAEALEEEVVEIFGLFVNVKYDYTVVYDDKFTPTYDEVALRLASSGAILKMNLSKESNLEAKKDIVRMTAIQNNWSQDTLDTVIKSLNGSPVIENEFETKNQQV